MVGVGDAAHADAALLRRNTIGDGNVLCAIVVGIVSQIMAVVKAIGCKVYINQ